MNNKLQVIVLCEDDQHFHFARKYLELRGINKRKIIGKIAPPGQGCGAQYVIEHYAAEVQAHRSKNYLSIALVVFLDDDTQTLQRRLDELNEQLIKNQQLPRQDNEKIALFIPARNIQTWFHYLAGNQNIEEKKDYKCNYLRGSYPTKSAQKLYNEICPVGLPSNAPSSLQHACKELQRLS